MTLAQNPPILSPIEANELGLAQDVMRKTREKW